MKFKLNLGNLWALAALATALVSAGCGGGNVTATAATVDAAFATTATVDAAAVAAAPPATSTLETALAANRAVTGKVASIALPATTAAVVGVPLTLAADVRDRTGKVVAGAPLAWQSADTTIATVSSAGIVTPLRAGWTTVAASAGSVSATTLLSVRGATPIPKRSAAVGTNLGGIAYYATQFPFANLLKNGGTWSSREDGGTSGAAFAGMTADGYPASLKTGQHAITPVAWDNTHYAAGKYVVLWDGDGAVSVPMSNATVAESAANRLAVDVPTTTGQLWVSIDRTNPANPVRNVRFLWPGTEATHATQPFNPRFLEKVAPFSMLRFMDWGGTNGSPVVAWADRARLTEATWSTDRGVPIETMIELANTLHVDPWFCIPHRASDDYVTQFATLLKARLDPSLRPHIEYSNEVWNQGFGQTKWANAESDRLGLPRPWGTPSAFYAQRSVQIFKLMQRVYGATDSARLVRVIGGQAAWTQFQENALAWADTAANTDVLAIAPYFVAAAAGDPANVVATLALTSDQVVDQMLADLRGPVKDWIVQNAALAKKHGLRMKGYEGGPGDTSSAFTADRIDAVTALFASAHRNPRMRGVYTEFYGLWAANGGDLLNQYHDIGPWTKWGFWGALEYVTQDAASAPKYQGLLDYIAAHPVP